MSFFKKNPAGTSLGEDSARCAYLTLDDLSQRIKAEIAEAAYPEPSDELLAAQEDRAVAEVEVAAPLPINKEEARSDGWLLDETRRLQELVASAAALVQAARARLRDARLKLAATPSPMGALGWASIIVFFALLVVVSVSALAGLLTPTVDAYVYRAYWSDVLSGDAEIFSAESCFVLSTLTFSMVMGGVAGVVLWTRGRIPWHWKLLIFVGEIAFGGGFAVMRLGGTFSYQALSISILELGLTIFYTALVMTVGKLLALDAPKVEPYRLAKASAKAAASEVRDSEFQLRNAETALATNVLHIAKREGGVRRHDFYLTLAKTTTKAAHLAALAKLVADAARTPEDEKVAAEIETHLAAEFGREELRRSTNAA